MTKFGVHLPKFSGFDPADLFDHVASLATTAEDAGFDSVLDELIPSALHTVERYANNPVEADHGR